ncbi:MAG: preprotein translocase subunit SecE [Bdellovibrionia bacterium]
MESTHQKWVNLSFVAISALLGYIIYSSTGKLVALYDLEARVRYLDLILRVVSVLSGGILFLGLYLNEQANQFMNEVVVELTRVSWPTPKDTRSATMIVILMVVISGLVLSFLDYFWVQALKWLL